MSDILVGSGFWFAVGVIIGLAIEFGGRFFFDWWYRPQLRVSLHGLWPVTTDATILSRSSYRPIGEGGASLDRVTVRAYRFKVENKGRLAAKNVAGTLEFSDLERRVCWYEGSVE